MNLTTSDLNKRLEKVTVRYIQSKCTLQDVQHEIFAVLTHYPDHAHHWWVVIQALLIKSPKPERLYHIVDYSFTSSRSMRIAAVQSLDVLLPKIVSLDSHHMLMLDMLQRWASKFPCYVKNSLGYEAGPLAIALLYMRTRTPQIRVNRKRPVQALEFKIAELVKSISKLRESLEDGSVETPTNTQVYQELRKLVPQLHQLNNRQPDKEASTLLQKCVQFNSFDKDEDDQFLEVTIDGLKEQPVKKPKVRKERSQVTQQVQPQYQAESKLVGRTDGLFAQAPVVEFGEDLQYWDNAQPSGLEFKHRFLGESQSEQLAPPRLTRTVYYKDLDKKEK